MDETRKDENDEAPKIDSCDGRARRVHGYGGQLRWGTFEIRARNRLIGPGKSGLRSGQCLLPDLRLCSVCRSPLAGCPA